MVQGNGYPIPGALDAFTRIDDLLVRLIDELRRLNKHLDGTRGLPQEPTRERLDPNAPIPVIVQQSLVYEIPAIKLNLVTTDSEEWMLVTNWEIPPERIAGILSFVELWTDNYNAARWRLVAAGQDQFSNKQIRASVSFECPDIKLAPGSSVEVYVRSDDGAEVTANVDIIGKELVR